MSEENLNASNQFRNSVLSTFYQMSQESDLTAYEAIGALEVIKAAIIRYEQDLNSGAALN